MVNEWLINPVPCCVEFNAFVASYHPDWTTQRPAFMYRRTIPGDRFEFHGAIADVQSIERSAGDPAGPRLPASGQISPGGKALFRRPRRAPRLFRGVAYAGSDQIAARRCGR